MGFKTLRTILSSVTHNGKQVCHQQGEPECREIKTSQQCGKLGVLIVVDFHVVTYFGQHLTKIIQRGCYSADRFITAIIIICSHSVHYSFPSLPFEISIFLRFIAASGTLSNSLKVTTQTCYIKQTEAELDLLNVTLPLSWTKYSRYHLSRMVVVLRQFCFFWQQQREFKSNVSDVIHPGHVPCARAASRKSANV